MREFIKNQLIDLVETIKSGIEYAVSKHESPNLAQNMLMDCYEGITSIKQRIGNNVSHDHLENYTKSIENIQEKLELLNDAIFNNSDFNVVYKEINKMINDIKSMLEQEEVKLEVVFFPYKASMWDSLESIWLAAKEDKNCEAYVVAIPYFDRNPDGSLGEMHYEGTDFPEYVSIVDWKSYSLEKRKPDIGYVHNPYDDHNLVTCVHPDYFSANLKKYIDTLVYVPYYSTSSGLSEAQGNLPSYRNFDYIIAQSEWHANFYNSEIKNKLLPFGSPKFDKVINSFKDSSKLSKEWEEKIKGRRVYFFNTSIAGALKNTRVFLNKIKYVFDIFNNNQDAILLWRPHPLLESTLRSMRPQFFEFYLKLKQYFTVADIGILDKTPDAMNAIRISDGYIGDSGSSLISIFGIAAKPIFILDNWIDRLPNDEDWSGNAVSSLFNSLDYAVSFENKLFKLICENDTVTYKYLGDISQYSFTYYSEAKMVKDKIYLCPKRAQDIGVLKDGVLTKIPLKRLNCRGNNFNKMFTYGKYIILIPSGYPAIVRYNIETEKADYFSEAASLIRANVDGETLVGGACLRDNNLFIASPTDNIVVVLDILTGKHQVLTTQANQCGCAEIFDDGKNLWLMPFKGRTIVRWDPVLGESQEYNEYPENFRCTNLSAEIEQDKYAFRTAVSCGDYVLFAPWWANMFIKIDKKTGAMSEWKPPFEIPYSVLKGYYNNFGHTAFFGESNGNEVFVVVYDDRALYKVNLETNEYKKIKIEIDVEFLRKNTAGFSEVSEWFPYACLENEFNSLEDFINNNIKGKAFNKEKQLSLYGNVVANIDGTCGEKVHNFIMGNINSKKKR